jgi:hypothetical protein
MDLSVTVDQAYVRAPLMRLDSCRGTANNQRRDALHAKDSTDREPRRPLPFRRIGRVVETASKGHAGQRVGQHFQIEASRELRRDTRGAGRGGAPGDPPNQAADREDFTWSALIASLPARYPDVNRLIFGSTTHHVIREGGCPVLTLHE